MRTAVENAAAHVPPVPPFPRTLDDDETEAKARRRVEWQRLRRRVALRSRLAGAWAAQHLTLLQILTVASVVTAVVALAYWEVTTSGLEANYVTSIAADLTYKLQPGLSRQVSFPKEGPYDIRLGYAGIPRFTKRLLTREFDVDEQVRLSPLNKSLVDRGLFPIFQEKSTHGLTVFAADDSVMYEDSFPKDGYARFQDVPPLVVASLLFIEDRQVLDDSRTPTLNPAISWDRLTKASLELMLDKVLSQRNVPGGSTLATQIEKFRHSAEGRTRNTHDKLRQMASATARAYLLGRDTRTAREQIVLDYVNGVPLGAVNGVGEVTGIGEGLRAWYGQDLASVNAALASVPTSSDRVARRDQALAFKRVLALFLSQRRPAYYLQRDQHALETLTDNYIRLMGRQGLVTQQMAMDAIAQRLALLPAHAARPKPVQASFVDRKATNAVRFELQRLLGVKTLYELDRLDADVKTSYNRNLQDAVTQFLVALKTPENAVKAGLVGDHLLHPGQAAMVNYSFTLLERLEDRNAVRVQADTIDSPLDINGGGKLELGSTAKLRTLITYLDLISELRASVLPHAGDQAWLDAQLAATMPDDDMSRWLLTYVRDAKTDEARTLPAVLEAAMQRHFSASPWASFWTAGGQMHFVNFDNNDNYLNLTVAQAFQRSNNLVFVRVMHEVVQHVIMTRIDGAAAMLKNPDDPRRQVYLERFVDMESKGFLRRFYRELKPLSQPERLVRLKDARHLTTTRLAAIVLSTNADLDYPKFRLEMLAQFPDLEDTAMERYWKTIHPDAMSLADRAYTARVHPLELWLASHLATHPDATMASVLEASREARFQSYTWLFDKAGPRRQERDIRTMLEREAFGSHIIKYWKRQGFPFDTMAPSIASALGSSGDRPSALADLMGAVFNDGVMLPTKRLDEIRFAKNTPFETALSPSGIGAKRVTSPEVAAVVQNAVHSVVDGGTAQRLRGSLKRADGSEIPIAAKTGTGDNRFDTYGAGGRLIHSEAKSRTATLVFAIGDRFFGTVTAYVKADDLKSANAGPGESKVDDFAFTSSLVSQTLKSLIPTLSQSILRVEDPWAFAIK